MTDDEVTEESKSTFNQKYREEIERHIHIVREFECPCCGYTESFKIIKDRCPACGWPEFRVYKWIAYKKSIGQEVIDPWKKN